MPLSPTSGPGGDGSGVSTEREHFNAGAAATIANGGDAQLPVGASAGPNVLVDRSTPAAPVVLAAGVYAIAVNVLPAASLTAGGYFTVRLEVDPDNVDMTLTVDSPLSGAAYPAGSPAVVLALTMFIPAGGGFNVAVSNRDGVAARDFRLQDVLVQLIG